MRTYALSVTALALFACATQPDVEQGSAFQTDSSSPLAWAPAVEFGSTTYGTITTKQLDLWHIDLHAGDQLTIVKKVVAGDLAPELRLFGPKGTLHSTQYEVTEDSLSKSYDLTASGRHFIGVRAYHGKGTGDYALTVSCTGGPCGGDPITKPLLDPPVASACIKRARECAFDAMGTHEGTVDLTVAQQLFAGCLAQEKVDGMPCKQACEGELATRLCNGIVEMVPFYASQSQQCLQQLSGCLEACYEWDYVGIDGNGDGLYKGGEHMCLFDGMNGTCDAYARKHLF